MTELGTIGLRCELSKAAAVVWKKGQNLVQASDKFEMVQQGTTVELIIHHVEIQDEGNYTCLCGDQKTTAALTVHGKKKKKQTHIQTTYPTAKILSPFDGFLVLLLKCNHFNPFLFSIVSNILLSHFILAWY